MRLALLLFAGAALAQEPALPAGLEDEPALPAGLGEEPAEEAPAPERPSVVFDARGSLELRGGARLGEDPEPERTTLAEARAQLDLEARWTWGSARAVGDGVYDPIVPDDYSPDLETGEGAFDLRQAQLTVSPFEALDVKVGRQILTWGTGDLLFVNDLFPKDYGAFFLGRDETYLKAPSDALKVSLFTDLVNLDLVYTPRFDADRMPEREGTPPITRPDTWFEDAEYAARLHRRVGPVELAAYGYRGFRKSPSAFDEATGTLVHPELTVIGASGRGPLAGGILNAEGALYDDDEVRALTGYEHELVADLTLSGQYSLEHDPDDTRHLATARLTWLAFAQRLTASLFVFYDLSNEEAYLRPRATYALGDHWRAELGGNVLLGVERGSGFGQLEEDSNVYAATRVAW